MIILKQEEKKFKINKKKNFEIFKADIADYNKVYKKFKNVKYVFHLAALADIVPSIEDPKKYYKTNVTGTLMY